MNIAYVRLAAWIIARHSINISSIAIPSDEFLKQAVSKRTLTSRFNTIARSTSRLPGQPGAAQALNGPEFAGVLESKGYVMVTPYGEGDEELFCVVNIEESRRSGVTSRRGETI